MRIEQIEWLLTVIQYQSISKAAEKLFINQPTLSASVNALEQEIGIKLLERTHKGVLPTQAGKDLIPVMEAMVSGAEQLKAASRGIESNDYTATICACPLAVMIIMEQILPIIRKRHSVNRLHIREAYAGMVIREVAAKKASIGITAGNERAIRQAQLYATKNNMYMQRLHKTDKLMLACRQDHTLADQKHISFQELKNYPYALYEGSLPLNSLTATYTAYQGFREMYLFSNQNTLIHAIDTENLVTILPSETLLSHPLYQSGKIVCRSLADYDTNIIFYITFRSVETLTTLEKNILGIVRQTFC